MRILICCDSFKDALPAPQVCAAIGRGWLAARPEASIRLFPLADGGEGLVEALGFHLGLRPRSLVVHDPLGRPVGATYALSADGRTAFIEMAQAAGLQLLAPAERNPLLTSTVGLGEMVADALRQGVERIVMGIGGSATHDLGMGMAAALGWRFEDAAGQPLQASGLALQQVARILPPPVDPLAGVQLEVMCDVTNPLYGEQGAAHIYARQKGADEAMIAQLEAGSRHFWAVANGQGHAPAWEQAGAGAAGGLGFGTGYFLQARLRRGIDLMLDITGFDQAVGQADLIITGEGRLDGQTVHGKLISGIARRAAAQGREVIAFCGALAAAPHQLKALGLKAAFSIAQGPCSLAEALSQTEENLEKTAYFVGAIC